MNSRVTRSAFSALALSLLAATAFAQPADSAGAPHQITLSAREADRSQLAQNPQVRAFYDLSVKSLRKHRRHVDVDRYEQASYAIFRELGHSMGVSPEGMVEHLKGIPREIVMIVKTDPATLDSFDNFLTALIGPP